MNVVIVMITGQTSLSFWHIQLSLHYIKVELITNYKSSLFIFDCMHIFQAFFIIKNKNTVGTGLCIVEETTGM